MNQTYFFDLTQLNQGEPIFHIATAPPIIPANRTQLPCCPVDGRELLDLDQDDLIVLICEKCGAVWPTLAPADEMSVRLAARATVPPGCIVDATLDAGLIAEYQRQYYEQNRDQIAEKKRQYREQNRDQIAEKQRQYYEQNRDQIAEKQRQYREQNRDQIAEKQRAV